MSPVKLMNADGRGLSSLGLTTMKVQLNDLKVNHTFVVVENLSVPAILGCDFLTTHDIVLDFGRGTFRHRSPQWMEGKLSLQPHNSCNLVLDEECPPAMPFKSNTGDQAELDMPTEYHPALRPVLREHQKLFKTQIGRTHVTEHVIDTGDAAPVKVPPRPIPFHYQEKVQNQLQEMAQEGIIRPSSSPWSAPAVYVPKSNGEVRICVDFVQLNKVTKKDSYPVPRADGPQMKMANKKVFSKLDLKSAYWQFPMNENSIEKTAFCPGPGYGLWEFTVMPYGLTGATQTCQRGMDDILRDCKDCVDNYVDDCIVFSDNMASHTKDLGRVLSRLEEAGLTLRGSKCLFGLDHVSHLGFEYSCEGVTAIEERSQAVATWPTPTTVREVRKFLGLVNFSRRFIPNFADKAAPLTELTGDKATFTWEDKHNSSFETLKQALTSPPVLDYPRKTDKFVLTTDASDVGIGAVLSTARGTVVEYASHTLSATERKYATIEKECLAIVWAVQKFRHYLIGAHFTLETDHKPLEWLESARASRARSQRLERWSLELRAFEFTVVYKRGKTNQNADALSRRPVALVAIHPSLEAADIALAQREDPVLSLVSHQLKSNDVPPPTGDWSKFPLKRYRQIWSQLILEQDTICRKVKTPSREEDKLVPVIPRAQQGSLLRMAHEQSGHQGVDKTLARLSEIAYWVGMARDVTQHCKFCRRCQITKAPEMQPAPLQPVIASHPWEIVAVDILKVPMSSKGNQYILVAQDYFSKWPFARAIQDQKAETIVRILKDDIFSLVGPPKKLHSDQGRNFESRVLSDLCQAFGVKKSRTTPYHPMGDGLVERMNRSLLSLLRSHIDRDRDWEEHLQLLLFLYRTTRHATTGLSPYEILFGTNPPSLHISNMPGVVFPDPSEYSSNLQSKILELRELVEANIVEAADLQQRYYHSSETGVRLRIGQQAFLSNPTKGKLDPRWTGPWTITGLKGPSTILLKIGTTERAVHINRVRPLLTEEACDLTVPGDWHPPLFHHQEGAVRSGDLGELDCSQTEEASPTPPLVSVSPQEGPQGPDLAPPVPTGTPTPVTTRSGRQVKPVQRYGWT